MRITELPHCPWRELVADGIRCRHARVHAVNDRVPAAVCTHCTQRLEPCDVPRPPNSGESEQQLPPLWVRMGNFGVAVVRHLADGGQQRTPQEIARIFEQHCRRCPHFDGQRCTHAHCGCQVAANVQWLNKIAWASEHCPIGKW